MNSIINQNILWENYKMAYPIYFTNNTCLKCGATGTLRFLDARGQLTRDPIYPVTSMVCTKCKGQFYIDWLKEGNNYTRPICVDKSYIDNIESKMEQYALQQKRGVKIS